MKYIIDRTKWLRGEGFEHSKLLREIDQKMCCLGQIALQCGIAGSDLLGTNTPDVVGLERFPKWFQTATKTRPPESSRHSDVSKAMMINDERNTTDAEKEKALWSIFLSHGDELEFIN
jgi:hypothetical protein